jgi:hypothetical protein
MATKSTKSVGNGEVIAGQTRQYWQQAAKQFQWPIEFNDLQILVPEVDLPEAEQDLMVQHFRNNGWHVQSVIEVVYTKPYIAPVQNKPIFRPVAKPVENDAVFKCNQQFKISSTEDELRISGIDKKTITLSYTNKRKEPITTSPENLAKMIRMGLWIKL